MNKEVWCFLVSANKYLDYRTVVAPDFMCEKKYTFVLAQTAGGEITDKDTAHYRKIINSKVGDLTLVFRVIEALETDIGISGDGNLKDSFGRVINLIEGIVFKGEVAEKNICISSENFREIHNRIIEHFQKFWDEITPIPAYASKSFSLGNNVFQLIKLDDYIAVTKHEKEVQLVTDEKSPEKEKSQEKCLEYHSQSWQSKILRKFRKEINSIAIYPSGKKIAIRYDENKIVIQILEFFEDQTREDKTLLDKRQYLGGNMTPIVIDSTGKFLITSVIEGYEENVIKLWDLNTKKSRQLGSHEKGEGPWNRVTVVAFTPDSETVLAGYKDGNIKLWDASMGGEIRDASIGGEIPTTPKHDTQIRCMAVDNKNNIIASGDQKGNIKIWELGVASLTEKTTILASRRPINSLAFSTDGKILVSGSDDCTIKLWDTKTGQRYDSHEREHSTFVNSVAFSSDRKLIASGDNDGTIQIWSLKSPTAISICKKHTRAVTSVVFTPDSKLISGGKDGQLIMWEMGAN